ncbi:regulating synaptic membrane exocytosis protein 3-like [Carassius gibelio]|uniref:regulating synaptic membrane exocytosis protein 3-like n=1 Tax=Carassius gibelio TaxID=101364 RepID=UPI0022780E23|nr:regulating synaptic membrane exocytosis protein 3-like [Carassius gibelio]
MRNRVTRQGSKDSTDGSTNSNSSDGTFIFPPTRLGPESQFSDFLDGLGPAQIVGRQTLATPPMGDVYIGVVDRGGQLEVEITQARGLTPKPGSKNIPATYVKVYVLENGMCLAKKKTKVVKKTLDPTFQQSLMFDESPQGKVLQKKTMVLSNFPAEYLDLKEVFTKETAEPRPLFASHHQIITYLSARFPAAPVSPSPAATLHRTSDPPLTYLFLDCVSPAKYHLCFHLYACQNAAE